MGFTSRKEPNGVLVVEVEGQLIVGNRQEFKQKILDALEAGERKFLVDFTQTGYIDSSGLGALVSLSKKVREVNGELRIAGLTDCGGRNARSSRPSACRSSPRCR